RVGGQMGGPPRLAGIAPERIHRVSGVVELARFMEDADPAAVRAEPGMGAGCGAPGPIIRSCARPPHTRGQGLLIRGFQPLLGRYPSARLLLVGKGEARPRLEAMVHELGLERGTIFPVYREG